MSKSNSLSQLFQQAGVRNPPDLANQIIFPPGKTPMEHQVSGIKLALRHRKCGIYDEAGAGKTLIIQAWQLFFALYGTKSVVLMPPGLMEQFKDSLLGFFVGADKHITVDIYSGTPVQRKTREVGWNATGWPDILLCSYQMFTKLGTERVKVKRGLKEKTVTKLVKAHPFVDNYSALACDEAHRGVGNTSSWIHKIVKRWMRLIPDAPILLSTGTPMGKEAIDALGLIMITAPGIYSGKDQFKRQHAIIDTDSQFRQIVGWKNLPKVRSALYLHARRVTKAEVHDLPPLVPVPVAVKLSPQHRALYRQVMKMAVVELPNGKVIPAVHVAHLRQLALQIAANPSAFSPQKTIPNMMMEALHDVISGIGMHQTKVIIFAQFQRTVEYLFEQFGHAYNAALIYGPTGHRKEKERQKFLHDETCRMLIANYDSGGEGFDFQSVCSHVVFYEVPTVPRVFAQAAARAHRPGQMADKVTAYLLYGRGTYGKTALDMLMDRDEILKPLTSFSTKEALLKDLLVEEG